MHGLIYALYFNPQERRVNQDAISDSEALAELQGILLISTLWRRTSIAGTLYHLSKRTIMVDSDSPQQDLLSYCIGKANLKKDSKQDYKTDQTVIRNFIMRDPIWGC